MTWEPQGLISSKGTHYILEGEDYNDLVIFVHGIGTHSFYFEGFAAHMRDHGNQTLRYDNMGMGHSCYPANADDDPSLWKGRGHIEQLHDLIVELKLHEKGKYVLCGHSMGGAISTIYAATYPSEVKAIILLSPAGLMSPWSSKALGAAALRNVIPNCLLPTIFNGLVKDSTNINNIRKFGDFMDPGGPANEKASLCIQQMHLNNKNAIKALFNCARFFPLWECHEAAATVAASSVHVLVLHGESDATIPVHPTCPAWQKALNAKSRAKRTDNGAAAVAGEVLSPLLSPSLSSVELVKGAHGFFLEFPGESHQRVVAWLRAVSLAETEAEAQAARKGGEDVSLPKT